MIIIIFFGYEVVFVTKSESDMTTDSNNDNASYKIDFRFLLQFFS